MVNRKNFILEDIPMYHPESLKYLEWWRDQKKKCIEGYWNSGYWMPGNLYFYINFGTILVNKTEHSTSKEPGKPLLRDLEWEFFYNWAEARGFSGFINDEEYTCNRNANPSTYFNLSEFERNRFIRTTPNAFKPDGSLKTYVDARVYLRRQHARDLGYPLFENMSKDMMMLGSRGFGKDLIKGTLVHRGEELVPIENIQIGDDIIGNNGLKTKVTNKFEFKDQEQFKFTLDDKREVTSGLGHKWLVYDAKLHKEYVTTTEFIIHNLTSGSREDTRFFIPQNSPVEYSEKEYFIHPYLMGALLGDGGLTQRVTLTTADTEIIDNIREVLPKGTVINKLTGTYAYSITGELKKNNPIKDELTKLGLMGKDSLNKFIPKEYLQGSIQQRLELLQGLMDTDGFCSKEGSIEYSSSCTILAENVVWLLRSLGIKCNISKRKTKCEDNYRVMIKTSMSIFKLKRKLDRLNINPSKYTLRGRNWNAIRSAESVGIHPSYCLSVDNKSKLFLVNDFVVTHNSFSVGVGIVLHEWLFDGQTKYIPAAEQKVTPKSTTVVGAGDGKYSTDLLLKTSFALDFLPGNQQIGNKYYPCPFTKKFKGSWNTNNNIIAKYKKKVGGEWKNLGTFSEIKHRSFKDNPFAANGIRAGVMVFEEIGMFDNLIASRNSSVECQQDGSIKYGSMMFLGTGGDMDRGTIDASIMFNDPAGFNLLEFDDVWENRGKIGYFVPAYRGLNQYKDDNGFTIEEPARQYLEGVRKTLREGKSGSSAIDEELQNRPLVPSEVFLTKKGNIFPIDALRKRLIHLESEDNYRFLEKPVELFFDKDLPCGVGYKLDLDSKLRPLNNFPLTDKQKSDRNGCVIIYEFPMEVEGQIPKDMYLIGHDPYASDDPDGESLGAIYVIKNKKYVSKGYDEIVASFIGRPEQGRWVVNENLYKLSLFYGGCKIYFENIRGNTLEYFEKIRRLDLLAAQPETILNKKSATRKSGSIIYGYPMSNDKMKAEGVMYVRDWLVEERGIGQKGEIIRNLDLIPDKALLQELIAFNYTGNFDRVMAFMGCMFGLEESHNRYIRHVDSDTKNVLDFLHNNRLVRSKRTSKDNEDDE